MTFEVVLTAVREGTDSTIERCVEVIGGYAEYAIARSVVELEYELGPGWIVTGVIKDGNKTR